MIVLIVDGNNMAHRARHAFNLSNKGRDVSVTYGFLRMLKTLMGKFDPYSVIVCWDGGVPEFRRQLVPEYKAGRHDDEDPLAWEDFHRQLDELQYILPIMGVISVMRPGAEADDLMAQAARMLPLHQPIIVTNDKDLLQCVNQNISVYSPGKEILYTPEIIIETFGVRPHNIVEWKALQGDSSDNIPGVTGIGEKTATKLFNDLGTLSHIVNAALDVGDGKVLISDRHKRAIREFGFDRIWRNIEVVSLYADRVGARQAIIIAVANWRAFEKDVVKRWLMRNAFTSLMDGEFYGSLMDLEQPQLYLDGVRKPVVGFKRVTV